MITGVHAIIYTKNADEVRAFFRDVLEFSSVNAGEDWLIFALPPAEPPIQLPGGGALGLYQPTHPTAIKAS